jgi:DNA helicase-2/ATP-dependent DNA helicase PcrA
LEEAFIKEEIPYNIVGTVRFYDRMEIKDMISYLRVLINPDDSVSLKRIINTPRRGIGRTRIEKFEDYARKENISLWKTLSMLELFENRFKIPVRSVNAVKGFVELIRTLQKEANDLSLPELARVIVEKTGYMKALEEEETYEAKDRIENIKEFISAINEFYERNNDEISKSAEMIELFLSNVSLSENMDTMGKDENIAGRVTLMTLHLAKGLEFPVVFITGMEEGLLPIGSAIANENELEEERRLCYVGMTRAKKVLYLTYADVRRIYGQIRNNISSRFIREVQVQTRARLPGVRQESVDYRFFNKAYKIGQRISHGEFGEGRIIKISGSDDDVKVTVMFDDGKWKKLLVKYANLKTI